MFFRPSGACGGFYSIPLPTACAMGYDLSPALRAETMAFTFAFCILHFAF
jgi:hypothetical protein